MGRLHIRNLMAHMKGVEEITSKRNRQQEIIKFRFKINNIEAKKQTENNTKKTGKKYWFFVKIVSIEKVLHNKQSRSKLKELEMKRER